MEVDMNSMDFGKEEEEEALQQTKRSSSTDSFKVLETTQKMDPVTTTTTTTTEEENLQPLQIEEILVEEITDTKQQTDASMDDQNAETEPVETDTLSTDISSDGDLGKNLSYNVRPADDEAKAESSLLVEPGETSPPANSESESLQMQPTEEAPVETPTVSEHVEYDSYQTPTMMEAPPGSPPFEFEDIEKERYD